MAEFSFANARRILQYRLEHRLKLARRRTDDLQYLRCRRLLFQRFGEIGSTLSQFVEQPGVFDGDDRLGGEAREQLNLLLAEGPYFLSVNNDSATDSVVVQHWHANHGSRATQARRWARHSLCCIVYGVTYPLCPHSAIKGATGNCLEGRVLPVELYEGWRDSDARR